MTEYVVDFGDEKSSAFVRLAMAQAEANGARLCEEIVRCRDCKWMSKDTVHYKACYRLHAIEFMVEPDGFCKWGKRKEVDE